MARRKHQGSEPAGGREEVPNEEPSVAASAELEAALKAEKKAAAAREAASCAPKFDGHGENEKGIPTWFRVLGS